MVAGATCTKCGETKPASGFKKNLRKRNGLQSWCRKCQNRKTTERNQCPERQAYMARYYLEHPEKFKGYRAKSDPAETRRRSRAWSKANPERRRNMGHVRRARKRANGVFVVLEKDLRRLYSSPCAGCGSREKVTIDHVVPISRGGRHSIGNMQPMCRRCNSSKNDRLMVEWRGARCVAF